MEYVKKNKRRLIKKYHHKEWVDASNKEMLDFFSSDINNSSLEIREEIKSSIRKIVKRKKSLFLDQLKQITFPNRVEKSKTNKRNTIHPKDIEYWKEKDKDKGRFEPITEENFLEKYASCGLNETQLNQWKEDFKKKLE
jgi:hypothetical protein